MAILSVVLFFAVVAGDPKITTNNGDVIIAVDAGNNVTFQMGNETVGVAEIESSARRYTDTKVQDLDLKLGKALVNASAERTRGIAAVKTELLGRLDDLGDDVEAAKAATEAIGDLLPDIRKATSDLDKKTTANIVQTKQTLLSNFASAIDNVQSKGNVSVAVTDGSTDHSPCTSAKRGKSYYSMKAQTLIVCDGSKWGGVADVGPLGSPINPAASCKAILAAHPGSMTGMYTLAFTDKSTYITKCEMNVDGGGWTRFTMIRDVNGGGMMAHDQFYPSQFRGANKCKMENVEIGTWTFSKTAMDKSDKSLLIMDADDRWYSARYHMYDFSGSVTCKDNFLKVVTGDFRGCSPKIYNWIEEKWEQTTRGSCNTNQHSQWNCIPCGGVRFHYGTRECANDGGNPPGYNSWGYFTGYQCACNCNDSTMAKWVKHWNYQYDKVSTDFYYR